MLRFRLGATLLLALNFLATPSAAAPWSVAFGNDDADEEARAVAAAPDGTTLVVGSRRVPPAQPDALAACFDVGGNLLWQLGLGGALEDVFTSVAFHPEGGWIVAGTRNGTANTKVLVARLTPDGAIAWERTWPGRGAHVVTRPDGSIVVATVGPARLVALDARGYVSWRRAWRDTHYLGSLDAAQDGSLLVTGSRVLGAGTDWPRSESFVALLSPDGIQRWARLDGCGNTLGKARFLADGSPFVVVGMGVATLRASDGSLVRFRRLPTPRGGIDAMAPTRGGSMTCVGSSPSYSNDPAAYEVAITRLRGDSSVQAALATRRAGEDRATGVAVLQDASTVIVGSTQRGGAADRDMLVMRLEPLIPSGACDLETTTVVAEAPTLYPLLPATLMYTGVYEIVQSAHDPVPDVYGEVRAPCGAARF